jgi:hypothetical protein
LTSAFLLIVIYRSLLINQGTDPFFPPSQSRVCGLKRAVHIESPCSDVGTGMISFLFTPFNPILYFDSSSQIRMRRYSAYQAIQPDTLYH